MPALAAMQLALRMVPYMLPAGPWAGSPLADSLPIYTLHADPGVRQEAGLALSRVVQVRLLSLSLSYTHTHTHTLPSLCAGAVPSPPCLSPPLHRPGRAAHVRTAAPRHAL